MKRSPACVCAAERSKAFDERKTCLDRRRGGGRKMRSLAVEPEDQTQVPLVADRHAVPATRLADDEEVGTSAREEMAGATRIAFLTDRANDDDLSGAVVAVGCHECGRERPLRVTRAAPVEAVAVESDGKPSLHGIDVSEEHNGGTALADPGDSVSRGVRVRREAQGPRHFDEPLHSVAFVSGGTIFLDERRQDADLIHSGPSRPRRWRETTAPPGLRAAGEAGRRSSLPRSRARPP